MDSNELSKRLAGIRVLVEPKPEHPRTQDYPRDVLPAPRSIQRVPAARDVPKAGVGVFYRNDSPKRCVGLESVWQTRRQS